MVRDSRRGSSLVLAIVAMTFVSLLGLAVVALTVSNIQMKQSEKESQANFYDVDSIMDEAMAGVQDMSAQASAQAYSSTLSAYSSVLSGVSTSLQDKYEKAFIADMVKILSKGNETFSDSITSYHYYDDVILAYFSGTNKNSYKSHADGKGTLDYVDGVLFLRELEVESTANDYTTRLKTDIRVSVPPLTSETHSEYLDYALIADNQIKADIGGGAKAAVEGSIYSGTVNRDTQPDDPEAGVIVGAGTELSIKAKKFISRGDILVRGGSTFNASGTSEGLKLWVENILTKSDGSSAGNNITLNGEINIADDLELNSESDNVQLTGSYYGYNYNSTYDGANLTQVSADSKMSSAILINGRNCTLNMENVKSLVLAGRTFISRNSGTEVYAGTSDYVTNRDIMMGESLSVKGAQLSYYVPSDFVSEDAIDPAITYPYELDGKIYFQYSDEPSKVYVFDFEGYNDYINVAGFDVRTYIDSAVPLTYYYRNDPDITPISYYYLNFSTKETAAKFYSVFSSSSPRNDSLKDVNKEFMSSPGISLNDNSAVFLRSGNVLYRDKSSGDMAVKITNESIDVDDQLQTIAVQKARQYMSEQMALLKDYGVVGTSNVYRLLSIAEAEKSDDTKQFSKSGYVDGNKETNLFDKLVDRTKLAAKGVVRSEEDGLIVRIEPGDLTWDSNEKSYVNGKDTGIIIATGNVELKDDFHGMIIAGGDITFATSNVNIYSAPDDVAELFKKDKSETNPKFVDMFTSYFRTVVDTSLGSSTTTTDEDNVTYENWDKK